MVQQPSLANPVALDRDRIWEQLALDPYLARLREGRLDLSWMRHEPGDGIWGSWGIKARPSARGLTMMDIDRVDPSVVLDIAPDTVAPRGAGEEPGSAPRNWQINEKWELWAENVVSLYEEACARQWSATRDIPWNELEEIDPELEKAYCQFLTFLTMGEFLATDLLAEFLYKINSHFYEVKLFIATQAMDEARHTEVFRKRIFANGGGMGMNISMFNDMSEGRLPDYGAMSYFLHLLAEGVLLDYFRAGEFITKTDVDKKIFRFVMQDEARHVSYGCLHLKYLLENAPDREEREPVLHAIADVAEAWFLHSFLLHPSMLESVAILWGEGLKDVGKGIEGMRVLWRRVVDEYLKRCERAGFARRERCVIPATAPF